MRRAILGTILTSCACWIGYAQSTDPPIAFEVASVKPGTQPTPQDMGGGRMMVRSGGCQGGPGSTDPGRLSCQNVSLSNFISTAYNLKRYQFAFPAWMDDARFDITAKAPAGATKEQLRSMEQNLLAERFKLVIHYEKKEMTVYELIVGKNGPKLKEAVPDPAAPADSAPPSGPPAIGTLKFDGDGFPILPLRSGSMRMTVMNDRMRMQASDQTMEQFASMLSGQLGKPVTDATGIKGKYDITLTCSPEGMGSMRMIPAPVSDGGDAMAAPQTDGAPTVFEAVQQQLGLKLEQKKGSVDILIVDHVEKVPTEN